MSEVVDEAKENVIDPVPKLSKKGSKGKKAEVEEAAAGENTLQKNFFSSSFELLVQRPLFSSC